MRFFDKTSSLLLALAVGSSLMTGSNAFSNGTLLPSYLCGPPNDGMPKAVSTVLPYLNLGSIDDPFNIFPQGNGTINIQIGDGASYKGAIAPTARQILGSFHNGANSTGAGAYVTGLTNPIVLVPTSGISTTTGAGMYTITPGAVHNLTIAVNYPGFNANGIALDGAFVYAMDTATGGRIGTFLNAGPTMTNWSACNLGGAFSSSIGIIHNQVLTDCSTYGGILWQAPATIQGTVQFIGAGVTDAGYGVFKIIYNTTTNSTAPSYSATVRSLTSTGLDSAGAFNIANTNTSTTLPQTVPNAATANAVNLPLGVGGTVVLSIFGGIVIGCIAMGAAWTFSNKKKGQSLLI